MTKNCSRYIVSGKCKLWEVSTYGAISGPYFPVFGLNTEIYGVNLQIQSEYRKYGPEKTPYLDIFHAVFLYQIYVQLLFKKIFLPQKIFFYFTRTVVIHLAEFAIKAHPSYEGSPVLKPLLSTYLICMPKTFIQNHTKLDMSWSPLILKTRRKEKYCTKFTKVSWDESVYKTSIWG